MPSRFAAPSRPNPLPSAAACGPTAEAAAALTAANRALWLATLSLMTAFMQMQAPAHRLLLARRIARNFHTLSRQECFDEGTRASFTRLQARWQAHAEQFDPKPAPVLAGLFRLLS
jgi:hypothetical protein